MGSHVLGFSFLSIEQHNPHLNLTSRMRRVISALFVCIWHRIFLEMWHNFIITELCLNTHSKEEKKTFDECVFVP